MLLGLALQEEGEVTTGRGSVLVCFLKVLLGFKASGLLCFSSECPASGSHGCADFAITGGVLWFS